MRLSAWALTSAYAALALMLSTLSASSTEWVLYNGRILTLDAGSTIAEAISLRGERIEATGRSKDLLARAAPSARIVDLRGRTVIPGLIDSHIHAIRAGLRYAGEVSWIGATTIAEAMNRIRKAAELAGPDDWIMVVGGWTPNQFAERRRPTAAEFEAAAPTRRVYVQFFYRSVWLSPAARHALRIDADTSLPGATAERDADGATTGWISGDTAAITGIFTRLPKPGLPDSIAGTRRFLAELNRLGITGVIDPGGHNLAPEDYEAILRLWQEQALTVRVVFSLSAPRPGSEVSDLQTLTRLLPARFGDRMLRFNGIGERVTWGMYNNDTPNDAQKDDLYRVAVWAARRGMPLTAHWNNDRSVHHLLDVFERVHRDVPLSALRWSIAHLHDASRPSLDRMKALGVGWLVQNGLHFAAPAFIAEQAARIDRSPPLASALALGLPVGAGTDANRVMSHNPFVSLKWMTDGRTVDGLPTRASAELVTREQALRLYTQGSAWFAFDEAERGSLEPGRLADLAVLDGDYLTVPAVQLPRLQSLLTFVGGKPVHAAGPFSGVVQERAPVIR